MGFIVANSFLAMAIVFAGVILGSISKSEINMVFPLIWLILNQVFIWCEKNE